MDFSTAYIQSILCTEVTANLQRPKRYFHCARIDSMYWKSVSTFGALLQFQYHSCDEIVYFSMDFSTAYIQSILCTEVTANLQRPKRYFHCARIDSMYWKSVSTFGALLHFQYHSCDEMFYFSMDFTTAFISLYPMYQSHGEPAENKTILSLCKTWFEVLKISIHFCGTSSLLVPYQ